MWQKTISAIWGIKLMTFVIATWQEPFDLIMGITQNY